VNADQVAAITITQAIQAIAVSAGIILAFAFLQGWPQAAWHTIRELFTGPLISPADWESAIDLLFDENPAQPFACFLRVTCVRLRGVLVEEQAWEDQVNQ